MPVDRSGDGLGAPAAFAFPIVPDDVAGLPYVTRGLYVGTAGNLACVMSNGDIAVFIGLLAGMTYPFRVSKVFATGTTAGSMLGLY